ncbi:polysaccharide lyase family 3 protein [Lophiostoma macrostomum CBS 122681]|uniref:Pectate lyase n=1 Tax=Lophiostoma macrostomum CBS 122681 TaxID=1314788 RepID=A0A6A6T9E0_9PLEO|nr:polysaccharide lyase family 3 protein [Lophiostoma macrostomum CBS 122681]
MQFSLSTIAAAALFFAATEAHPQGSFFSFSGSARPTGHHGGHHHGHGHNGTQSGGQPSGVVPSFGVPSGTGAAPAFSAIPTGAASVSFPVPAASSTGTVAAKDDEDEDSDDDKSSTSTSSASIETGSSFSNSSSSATATYAPAGTAASTTFPTAAGESTLSEPMVITDSFDGGMVRFGRGVECGGQSEGGDSDAVFQVEEGGTLKNVIIGADQSEGVHCMGACTIENVWWEAVCEDALTIKQESGVSYVIGGGAQGAEDKVVQHNGGGTVSISGFYVSDFGKMYRSCGNCDTMYERHVIVDSVVADSGSSTFVGINSNYGDTATITNSCITNTKKICEEFEGNDTGDEPESIGDGISASCIYTEADISAC